ncbi:MAG: Hsp70 family protein [Spirochaetia bacterium]
MAGSVIGIKIADGSFFPVLERSHTGKKKLVLTTVNDEQDSVQIDLYQGEDTSMEGAEYIGSLVVSSIQPAAKGEPEINMVLGIDAEGNLNATATDATTGEYESLSVSLESLDEEPYALPDFQLEESSLDELDELDEAERLNDFDTDFDTDEDLGESLDEIEESFEEAPAEETVAAGATTGPVSAPWESEEGQPEEYEQEPIAYSRPAEGRQPRRRSHVLLFVGFMILSLAALAFLVYFVFRMLRGPELPPLEARLPVTYLALSPLFTSHIPEGARGHRTRSPH